MSPKQSAPMVHRIPMTEARINLGQLAKRAHVNNEYFILEKDGIPVIGIMDAGEMEDYLELRDSGIREHIGASHQEFLAGKSRPMDEFLSARAGRNKARVKSKP